ncbi:MAG: SRPBCC domain-containing protein [Planctomycetia bacterium]|nr:SRPBCC domain-containing protein [Planctomycetia bacterium]
MSVKKEPSGRRSVQVEVEVPGTAEEVWQAIATGPGVSSWFVPTEIDEREGGRVVSHFGPGMDGVATATAWDPPHRFAAESPDLGPNAPPLATAWIVEARAGGTCIVRVVHSLFASTDDWDDQLESIESGWPTFFRILRLYLAHFRGQKCAMVQLVGAAVEPRVAAWEALVGALGLSGATAGQRWSTPGGMPRLAGLVEQTGDAKNHCHALLRLDEPAPGIASLIATSVEGKVYHQVSLYFYGERGAAAAARDRQPWNAWMNEHFPFG